MKTKAKRIRWGDRTLDNDIKYGGFLSYRHLRIIGWACLIIAQVGVVLKLEGKLAPATVGTIDIWNTIISVISGLTIPMFLLANLSTILQKRGNFKALFIKFGGMALGMYILANFIVFHYGFQSLNAVGAALNWADAARFFGELLPAFGKTGYTLNIFIDMLLVVLMFFFANYAPNAKAFQGKRIALFRLMILLPVAYEVAGIILKYKIGMGEFSVPSPVFFLLPSKPPLIFAAFFIIVAALKISEVAYLHRKGHTQETYEEHIKTKAHSLKISVGISSAFTVIALIDLALFILLLFTSVAKYQAMFPKATEEQIELYTMTRMNVFENIGFGGAVGLILAVPVVMLFSYTKTHKNPKIDLIIPIAGVALIVLVLLEGIFQVITLNLPIFFQKIREFIDRYVNGEPDPQQEQAAALLSWIRNIHL